MVAKGSVLPNHIPVNNYELIVVGLPQILFTEISGLEDQVEQVDLPDRTRATGGNSLPTEFTAMMFEHHTTERAALEVWFAEGKDPVSPTYKKTGTLIKRNLSNEVVTTNTLTGLWISQKVGPDLELSNAGDPAMIEWTFQADSVEPV